MDLIEDNSNRCTRKFSSWRIISNRIWIRKICYRHLRNKMVLVLELATETKASWKTSQSRFSWMIPTKNTLIAWCSPRSRKAWWHIGITTQMIRKTIRCWLIWTEGANLHGVIRIHLTLFRLQSQFSIISRQKPGTND